MSEPADQSVSQSEFVLDDAGPDDEDEEMLAFEAARRSGAAPNISIVEGVNESESGGPGEEVPTVGTEFERLGASEPYPDAVVLEGIPGGANRAQVESFLDGAGEITAFRICRRPDATITARVQFSGEEGAAAAMKRDGAAFSEARSETVSVSGAPADWDAFIRSEPSTPTGSGGAGGAGASAERRGSGSDTGTLRGAVMIGNVPVNLAEALPDVDEVKSAFWGAVAGAKAAAEALDARARAAGADIDRKFRVAEQVSEATQRSQRTMEEVDKSYKVREKMDAAAAAARVQAGHAAEGVKSVDDTYGISRAIGEVGEKVSRGASVAAREVDENLRISERAREVANSALQNESFSPVVKRAVSDAESAWESVAGPGGVEGSGGRARKERRPMGVEQDACEPGVPSFAMDAFDDETVSTPEKRVP